MLAASAGVVGLVRYLTWHGPADAGPFREVELRPTAPPALTLLCVPLAPRRRPWSGPPPR
ncbi:hypothetical protein [Streptomyces aurantiogriseus]|uniref:hypothetical protein n=1 Tax=Streptomyces aurantiogriseus TaxID=66870 RepID=UPI00167BF82D|nr:hypothetical protein [Streptomyces aurantiogriseus]